MSWCDLHLTFDLAVEILKLKILFKLTPGNCKVYKFNTWYGNVGL